MPHADAVNGRHPRTRTVVACAAASVLEYYDHFVYALFATLVFPKVFFPQTDPTAALLLSMATYGAVFVARPLGAVIFGNLGDRRGRLPVLVATMTLMGSGSMAIGLLPGYERVGVVAPAALVACRLLQGIALGGAWSGSVVLIGEQHSVEHRRGFLVSTVQAGAPAGLLIAAGVYAVLLQVYGSAAITQWAWRIPFLLGGALVLLGLYVAARVEESELMLDGGASGRGPVREVFSLHRRALALAFGARLGGDIAFYAFGLFLLFVVPDHLGLPQRVAVMAVVAAAIAQAVTIPVAGWLTDRVGRRPVLMVGAMGTVVWAFAEVPLLSSRDPRLIVGCAAVGVGLVGLLYAPLAAFLPELFPTRVRVTGSALGFQGAGMFGGGIAPVALPWLVVMTGSLWPVAMYVAAGALVVAVAVALAPETRGSSLAAPLGFVARGPITSPSLERHDD